MIKNIIISHELNRLLGVSVGAHSFVISFYSTYIQSDRVFHLIHSFVIFKENVLSTFNIVSIETI